jgi:hypothetical protein
MPHHVADPKSRKPPFPKVKKGKSYQINKVETG